VVVAKLVVATAAGLLIGAVAAVAGLVATAAFFAAQGGSLDVTAETVVRTTLGGVAWCGLFGALGVGVGALVRNLAGAITAALAWLALVEGVAAELLGDDLGRWLPFRSGTALTDLPAVTGTPGLTQAQAALALVAYASVLAVAGVWATVSRDVS
jgi:ABC-2 type transport system permease protein